uniref:Sprouty-related, EVH1 domain-containing protein 2 n=1 Tax=Jaculus jaculus TaxID=51337 RepID=A0A8C5P3G7_JACJA
MHKEAHPSGVHVDSYIVRVKAVVMTRDDSSGGWFPQEGGGISRVGVCKVMHPEGNGRSGLLIHGERQKDKLVNDRHTASLMVSSAWRPSGAKAVLDCYVRKDLVYTKANPTFHHWKVDNRKLGLTFPSPANARAFDRGVRKAIEDLIEGSTTSSSTIHNEAELGDDDVFTTATDSSSNSSQKKEQHTRTISSPTSCEHRRIYTLDPHPLDHYLPEQVSRRPRFPGAIRVCSSMASFLLLHQPGTLLSTRFSLRAHNRRGRCHDAPDPARTCIRRASCLWCAHSLLYHCMSDPEGDYADPCSCDTSDDRFCLRWMALVALSLLAPCMCCYLPLRACYHCGVLCRCCGGKHKAAAAWS